MIVGRPRSPAAQPATAPDRVRVEVLYFDGCPNHEALVPHLRQLLSRAGARVEVRLRRVESAAGAERERFLGSPTVRIAGCDVDPEAGGRRDFGLKCRLYETPGGLRVVPPDEWVLDAIARAGSAGDAGP